MSKVIEKIEEKKRPSVLFEGVERLICPIVVFCIGYLHHLYFSHTYISPIFVACSLVSVMLVLSYKKAGLIASAFIQFAIVSYVLADARDLFLEQVAFSLSVYAALTATYLAEDETIQHIEPQNTQASEQKEKLWQELFAARQEITELYQQKQDVEAKLQVIEQEKMLSLEEIAQKIEVLEAEKCDLLEDKQEQEADIAKLLDTMREMAEREQAHSKQVHSKQEFCQKDIPLQPFEAMYKQLKEQFEEKTSVLDQTRKELFHAQEEVEVLKRRISFEAETPTDTEKALSGQLTATTEKLEAVEKKHEEELVGYEEVIGRLLQQLNQT